MIYIWSILCASILILLVTPRLVCFSCVSATIWHSLRAYHLIDLLFALFWGLRGERTLACQLEAARAEIRLRLVVLVRCPVSTAIAPSLWILWILLDDSELIRLVVFLLKFWDGHSDILHLLHEGLELLWVGPLERQRRNTSWSGSHGCCARVYRSRHSLLGRLLLDLKRGDVVGVVNVLTCSRNDGRHWDVVILLCRSSRRICKCTPTHPTYRLLWFLWIGRQNGRATILQLLRVVQLVLWRTDEDWGKAWASFRWWWATHWDGGLLHDIFKTTNKMIKEVSIAKI